MAAGTSPRPRLRLPLARPFDKAGRGPFGEREGSGVAKVLAREPHVGETAVVEPGQQGELAPGLGDRKGKGNEPGI